MLMFVMGECASARRNLLRSSGVPRREQESPGIVSLHDVPLFCCKLALMLWLTHAGESRQQHVCVA